MTGAVIVTAAAVPHLSAAAGTAVYLSSISASLTPPWPRIGAYAASKAALDKMVEAWRGEHPDIGFTRLTVGDCVGGEGQSATDFNSEFDPTQVDEALTIWLERGLVIGSFIDAADLIGVVDILLRTEKSGCIPSSR